MLIKYIFYFLYSVRTHVIKFIEGMVLILSKKTKVHVNHTSTFVQYNMYLIVI